MKTYEAMKDESGRVFATDKPMPSLDDVTGKGTDITELPGKG